MTFQGYVQAWLDVPDAPATWSHADNINDTDDSSSIEVW